jgi:hypothetical protein
MYYNYARNMVTADGTTSDDASAATMVEPYLVYNEIKIYEDWLSYKDFAMIRVGDNYVTNGMLGYNADGSTKLTGMIGRLTSANTDGTTYGGGADTIGASVGTPSHPGEVTITPAYPGATVGHTEYPYRMDGIAPRLLKTNIGDIFTTNTLKAQANEYEEGDIVTPKPLQYQIGTNPAFTVLEFDKANGETSMLFAIVKKYTMPDGQRGYKVQRIA